MLLFRLPCSLFSESSTSLIDWLMDWFYSCTALFLHVNYC
jgi:hypothetical protein